MVTIIFESHATSLDNEVNLSSGHYDVDLSDLGLQQAKQLGERYKDDFVDAIFCSDLKRSYQTAQIAFADRNFKIINDKRLREIDYGQLTRHPKPEIDAANVQHVSTPFPGGQSYEQTTAMIKDFLAELLKSYDNMKIMIIGSRATQYGLEHLIKGVPLIQAITAPWQWQPGWIYNLEGITW